MKINRNYVKFLSCSRYHGLPKTNDLMTEFHQSTEQVSKNFVLQTRIPSTKSRSIYWKCQRDRPSRCCWGRVLMGEQVNRSAATGKPTAGQFEFFLEENRVACRRKITASIRYVFVLESASILLVFKPFSGVKGKCSTVRYPVIGFWFGAYRHKKGIKETPWYFQLSGWLFTIGWHRITTVLNIRTILWHLMLHILR